jgi:undecaprenyl pyrophosphate phosphatase UppP
MDPIADARRQAGLEIQELAEEFERGDESAFRRTRIACWVVLAAVTVIILVLMMAGADRRYLTTFWVVVVVLSWGGYFLSSTRQRRQTARLRALANRWLTGEPPGASP